jgi:type I restriction-modification system DNA methylase subunit
MEQAVHNKIVSFIWGIADDVLRGLFKRGKYPDVILPMCVLRRLDAVVESQPTCGRHSAARCSRIITFSVKQ